MRKINAKCVQRSYLKDMFTRITASDGQTEHAYVPKLCVNLHSEWSAICCVVCDMNELAAQNRRPRGCEHFCESVAVLGGPNVWTMCGSYLACANKL